MFELMNIFLCFSCFMSCDVDDPMKRCEYNLQVAYRYVKGTDSNASPFSGYIQSVTEYLYDSHGLLYQTRIIDCAGKANVASEYTLPPGRYSVVSWGNVENKSIVNKESVGAVNRKEMLLHLAPPTTRSNTGLYGNTERLYYGYRSFIVSEKGVTHVLMDMSHAHFLLDLVIKWRSKPPDNTRDFYILYKGAPSEYAFRPDLVFRDDWSTYSSDTDEPMEENDLLVRYIPAINAEEKLASHRIDVMMNVDKRIETRLITYRHCNVSKPLLSVYAGDKQVMKEIDLSRAFKFLGIELDRNFGQEFGLQVEIDGDQVIVSALSPNDWEEGGEIG